jgi:hypothetical protein
MIEEKKEKFPTIFAFHLSGIPESNFITPKQQTFDGDSISSTLSILGGRAFGGVLRKTFSEQFALETGLYLSNRGFKVNMSYSDSNIVDSLNFRFVTYELPLNAQVFVKMSEEVFANVALGFVANYKVSSAGSSVNPKGKHQFENGAFVKNKFGIDFNAQIGFEFRTRDKGYFYLGGSSRIGLTPLFTYLSTYNYQGNFSQQFGPVNGGFLSFDLRYYFHNVKNKGEQIKKGPIVQ